MIVGIEEADVRACQTRNTPSPGLRFLARGVQTRKGRRSAATLARVNTARNYELLRFVGAPGTESPRVPATLIFPMGSPSGT